MSISAISFGESAPGLKNISSPSVRNGSCVCHVREEKTRRIALFLFHLLSLPVSSFVVRGLAKIFDFEVLRHGTRFSSYFGILKNGADPSRGGSGSSLGKGYKQFIKDSKGYFHIFKDSEIRRYGAPSNLCAKMVCPKLHAALAGIASVPACPNPLLLTLMKVLAAIGNCFCPTLHFVYRKREIQEHGAGLEEKRFENDPHYSGLAYRTHSVLPNDRIGLVGICCQATPNDLSRAWKNNRCQFVSGIIMVLAGSILSFMGLGFVT